MRQCFLTAAVLAVCAFSACFYVITAFLLRRWLRSPLECFSPGVEPVTFFRPIKSGEPALKSDLHTFLQAIEPDDQVLIAVASHSDLRICEDIVQAFPRNDIVCYLCGAGVHENPKVAKLIQIEALAKHERWIILDSDTMVDRDVLGVFRKEWESSGATAISAPYFFKNCEGKAARFDALGTELSLWPGVAILRSAHRIDFLTGVCMGVRASAMRTLGGWKIFGSCLAEDYELGRAICGIHGEVYMGSTCIPLRACRMRLLDWILHQHRVFVTYRTCNPWGSFGILLTYGIPLSLAFTLFEPSSGVRWFLFFGLLALRTLCARNLPGSRSTLRPFSVLIVSLCEPFFWISSWLPLSVCWAGKSIRPKRLVKNYRD